MQIYETNIRTLPKIQIFRQSEDEDILQISAAP